MDIQRRDEETRTILSLFAYADNYRKQFEEDNLEFYLQYRGYMESHGDNRSNLHIPRTYEQLDTLRARFVKSFIANRPYIDFIAKNADLSSPDLLTVAEKNANLAAALVDDQLEKNKYPNLLNEFFTNLLIYTSAIISVGWRYETRVTYKKKPVIDQTTQTVISPEGLLAEIPINIHTGEYEPVEVEEVVWDDNEIKVIDYFDFWPDPLGFDIDTCRFVFQREWLTWDQLNDRLAVLEESGAGQVYELDKEELDSSWDSLESGVWERQSRAGISPEQTDGTDGLEDTHLKLYEVLHYWEDNRHCLVVNRKELAYSGLNPYWHGKKPFVSLSFEELSKEFNGMSAAQILQHLQAELNTTRNQRIDNISMLINRMWKRRRGADIDESQLVSRPNGIVDLDNMEDLQELPMQGLPASAYQEEAILKADMENVLATPPVVRGASGAKSETATEIVTKNTNSGVRFEIKILLYGKVIERLAYLMDENNKQFIDASRVIRIAAEGEAASWKKVDLENILGEHEYRPGIGSTEAIANREIRRQQLIQLYPLAMQDPYIDGYEFRKMFYGTFDIKGLDKLLKPKDTIEQEQMAAKEAAMRAQQNAMQRQQTSDGIGTVSQIADILLKLKNFSVEGDGANGKNQEGQRQTGSYETNSNQ